MPPMTGRPSHATTISLELHILVRLNYLAFVLGTKPWKHRIPSSQAAFLLSCLILERLLKLLLRKNAAEMMVLVSKRACCAGRGRLLWKACDP